MVLQKKRKLQVEQVNHWQDAASSYAKAGRFIIAGSQFGSRPVVSVVDRFLAPVRDITKKLVQDQQDQLLGAKSLKELYPELCKCEGTIEEFYTVIFQETDRTYSKEIVDADCYLRHYCSYKLTNSDLSYSDSYTKNGINELILSRSLRHVAIRDRLRFYFVLDTQAQGTSRMIVKHFPHIVIPNFGFDGLNNPCGPGVEHRKKSAYETLLQWDLETLKQFGGIYLDTCGTYAGCLDKGSSTHNELVVIFSRKLLIFCGGILFITVNKRLDGGKDVVDPKVKAMAEKHGYKLRNVLRHDYRGERGAPMYLSGWRTIE